VGATLNPLDKCKAASAAISRRVYPGRTFGATIHIPGWDTWLHIGAFVTTENQELEMVYVVVDFVEEMAIVVPIYYPVCAYPVCVDLLRPVNPSRVAAFLNSHPSDNSKFLAVEGACCE
jgi:hypothetical protein